MATTIRNKLLSNAQKALEKGNLTRAIKQYNKLLDLDPDDVRVRLRIGDLQARLGKRREAIETYEQVAEEYYYQGFYLKSVAVLKQILRLDSTRTDIQVKLAELYQQLNLVSDGMAQYRSVAEAFKARGDTDRYIEVLGRLADLDPDDVNIHITMGEQLSAVGRAEDAADAFARATDQLHQSGRIHDFIKVAERYTFHRSSDVVRLRRLIRVYLDKNDAKRALAKLQLLFKSDPKDPEGLELLAEAFLAIGKTPKAVKVLLELAEVYTNEGQEELAMETFRRIVSEDPTNADACARLGISPAREAGGLPLVPVEPLDESQPVNVFVDGQRPSEWRRLEPAAKLQQLPSGLVTCAAELDTEAEESVNRLLVEIDGYTKVGLVDHAYATVTQALALDNKNVTVRERAVHLAVETNNTNRAIQELLSLSKLCWEPDAVRSVSYLHHALQLSPSDADAAALRAELNLEGVDLEAFMLDRSEEVLEIVEVEEVEDSAISNRFDASDLGRAAGASGFNRQKTVVSESGFELTGAPENGPRPEPVEARSEKIQINMGDDTPATEVPAFSMHPSPNQAETKAVSAPVQQDWVPFAPVIEDIKAELAADSAAQAKHETTDDEIAMAAAELGRQLAMQDDMDVVTDHGIRLDPAQFASEDLKDLVPDEDEDELDDLFLDPDEHDDDEPEIAAEPVANSVPEPVEQPPAAEPVAAEPPAPEPPPVVDTLPAPPVPRHQLGAILAEKAPDGALEAAAEELAGGNSGAHPIVDELANAISSALAAEQGEDKPDSTPEAPFGGAALAAEGNAFDMLASYDEGSLDRASAPAETTPTNGAPENNGEVRHEFDLPPLPSGLPKELTDGIKEMEFYSADGLHSEAQTILIDITLHFPEHAPLIMERMEEIRRQMNP